MKVKDVVAVFSRFLALYILYQILFYSLPALTIGIVSDAVNFQNLAPIIAVFLCSLIMFLFFWVKSYFVAEKILGQNKENILKTNIEIEDIEKAGFAIVGMFVLAAVIPKLASIAALLLIDQKQLHRFHVGQSLESVFSLFIGLVLIFGANGLSGIVKRVRSWPDP